MSQSKQPAKKKNRLVMHIGFGCYGMPLGLRLIVQKYPDVWLEGKKRKLCKACVREAQQSVRELIEAAFKEIKREVKP